MMLMCNGKVVGQKFNLTLADVIEWGYDVEGALADYPIFDESKRDWLNQRIIDHFYLREIRCETPAQFLFYLRRTLVENMEPINVVFKSLEDATPESIRATFSTTTKAKGKTDVDANVNAEAEAESYSSTNPKQTMIGKDPTAYYDAGSKSKSTQASKTAETSTTDNSVVSQGYSGFDLATALDRYIAGVNNALNLVFAVLEPCFCQLWL